MMLKGTDGAISPAPHLPGEARRHDPVPCRRRRRRPDRLPMGEASRRTVIGTVGSQDKEELARKNGCDHVILYREEDFAKRVKEITDGEGVRRGL